MSPDGRLTAAELRELAADDVMDDVNGLRWDKDRLLGEVHRLRKLIAVAHPHTRLNTSDEVWASRALDLEARSIREEGGEP